MAAPAVATTSIDTSTSLGTNNAHTLPTGSTTGNLILVLVVHDSTTMPTASTGWTALTAGETNSGYTARWFARVLDGGANDTLTVSGAAQDHISAMLRITGHGVSNAALPSAIRFATPVNTGTATTTPDPPAANISDARDWLIIAATTFETTATGQSVSAAPTNYTTNALVGTTYRSANSTSAVALGVGFRQLTNSSAENPGTFTSTSRPYIAYTLAVSPAVTATASAPLGGMTGSASATVSRGPVTATAAAPLGALTGTATANVKHNATLAAPLGGLTSSASATVRHSATLASPLGGITATASATVTPAAGNVTATAAAPLGGLASSATATVKHTATASATLAGISGTATARVIHPATVSAPLGGLTSAANATVLHVVPSAGDAPLGGLQASATANVAHTATASAPLGGLAANATATGGTGIEAVPDDGGSHSYGPRPRLFERPRRLPRLPTRHTATCHAHLGGMTATATARIDWSVLADDEDVLALL